jgi:hypothetical protein
VCMTNARRIPKNERRVVRSYRLIFHHKPENGQPEHYTSYYIQANIENDCSGRKIVPSTQTAVGRARIFGRYRLLASGIIHSYASKAVALRLHAEWPIWPVNAFWHVNPLIEVWEIVSVPSYVGCLDHDKSTKTYGSRSVLYTRRVK